MSPFFSLNQKYLCFFFEAAVKGVFIADVGEETPLSPPARETHGDRKPYEFVSLAPGDFCFVQGTYDPKRAAYFSLFVFLSSFSPYPPLSCGAGDVAFSLSKGARGRSLQISAL